MAALPRTSQAPQSSKTRIREGMHMPNIDTVRSWQLGAHI